MQHILYPFNPHLPLLFVFAFKFNYSICSFHSKVCHLALAPRPCPDVAVNTAHNTCNPSGLLSTRTIHNTLIKE